MFSRFPTNFMIASVSLLRQTFWASASFTVIKTYLKKVLCGIDYAITIFSLITLTIAPRWIQHGISIAILLPLFISFTRNMRTRLLVTFFESRGKKKRKTCVSAFDQSEIPIKHLNIPYIIYGILYTP